MSEQAYTEEITLEDKIKVLKDLAESLWDSVVEERRRGGEGYASMTDEGICSMEREMKIFKAIICDYALGNIKGDGKK